MLFLNSFVRTELHVYQLSLYLQGFSYLSEVRTSGLLNLGKKHLDLASKLGKLDEVYNNWTASLNGLKTI